VCAVFDATIVGDEHCLAVAATVAHDLFDVATAVDFLQLLLVGLPVLSDGLLLLLVMLRRLQLLR
jgi:hypothetical protein